MDYSAIILTGGKSTRFGKDKTLLRVNGELIVQSIINKCKPLFSEIILVSNHSNKFGIEGVTEISDIFAGQGPLGGIHAGLKEAKNPVCFVTACDMPYFYPPLVSYLLEESKESDVVVPRESNGHLQPLFAVYNKRVQRQAEELLKENRSSILCLYDMANVKYIEEQCWKGITGGKDDVFYNINYAEDYERIRQIPIELESAVDLLVKNVSAITETVKAPILQACGNVAAEDIVASMNNPPFHRSPLDGYALRHQDSKGASREHPVRLTVSREVFAGSRPESGAELPAGHAARIMTGGVIPDGCDCVIRQEDTDEGAKAVQIYSELREHQNFCFCGEDIREGQKLLRRGDTLQYVHLGVLSSVGVSQIEIIRPAKAAVMCTGDELVSSGTALAPGKIYDSNLYMLAGRLTELGIETICYPPATDDVSSIAARIEKMAEEADVVITTGGVSVGKKDFLHEVFTLLNVDKLFWRVGLKPGTPVLCGMYRNKPLVCLSGNPFAATTTFELLVRPVLAKLTGRDSLMYSCQKARLVGDFNKTSDTRRFIRARLVGGEVFLNPGSHSSGVLFSMLSCNALIDIPAGSPPLKSGMTVDVVSL
ncbi:MAG: NTP transferase domain-containing protein [Treponema sp.]|nr:NTP transferase domain-containing protein [Treponema sp.]